MPYILREKGRDLTQSYNKNPYTHRKIQKATWQLKNGTKNFNQTTITDRLRTVSLSNNSHPTGVAEERISAFPLQPDEGYLPIRLLENNEALITYLLESLIVSVEDILARQLWFVRPKQIMEYLY